MFDRSAIISAVGDLGFPAGSYLVHTSAAMVLYGLLPAARDIDIAVNDVGWQHALSLGAARQADVDRIVEPAPGVEVFSGWLGEDLGELLGRAHTVSGVSLAAPEDILAFKRRLNRPKDAAHIRLLEAYTCNNH